MTFKRNLWIFLVLMIVSVFLFQNCATMVRGMHEKIPVTSNPIGAKVIVDGKEVGTTPLNLKLRRKKIHNIQIEKEGYEPFTVTITQKTSMFTSLMGNYIIGALPGAMLFQAIFPEENRSAFDGGGLIDDSVIIGMLFGWGAAIAVDFITGANYNLSPDNLILSLSKNIENPLSNFIMIDEEHFQKIKWIRVKF